MQAAYAARIAELMVEQPGVVDDNFLDSENGRKQTNRADDNDQLTALGAQIIAAGFIKGMSGKIQSLLGELESEVGCYIRGVTYKAVGVKADNGVEQLAKAMAAERKQFLKASIAHFNTPKWEDMKAHYDDLKPKAQKAKRIYEQNKPENWQAMIKAAFPQFDDDLITMLSGNTVDLERLPPHALKATENSESYALAANIALEQSARLCGMKPFNLGPRRIRELMDESEALKSSSKEISLETAKPRKHGRGKNSPEQLVSMKVH